MHNLKVIEDEILWELQRPQDQEELINKEILIGKLTTSRKISKIIGRQLLEINKAMKLLLEVSKSYKPVSMRAARFFFVSNDLVKLNSMYQFTHEWFLGFVKKLLQSAVALDDPRVKKDDHVRYLQYQFTSTFYNQVCQTMFEKDKILLSFLLAYKELECEVTIDMRQVEFFIKGPLAQESEIFNPINLSGYTPEDEDVARQKT